MSILHEFPGKGKSGLAPGNCESQALRRRPISRPGRGFGVKSFMRLAALRKQANVFAHEVLAHHFRLPRRGEEMAHSMFCYAFA